MEQYKDILNELQAIEMDIRGGSTAVLALIVRNKLFVANIGKLKHVMLSCVRVILSPFQVISAC